MGRQPKIGLDFWLHDVRLVQDPKLRGPRQRFGYLAPFVYECLLDILYSDKGYYIEYTDAARPDVLWQLAEMTRGQTLEPTERLHAVIESLVQAGLFDPGLYRRGVLSSKRVQKSYFTAAASRQTVHIDFSIWLLDEEEMRELNPSGKHCILQKFLSMKEAKQNREELEISRQKIGVFRPKNPQSREEQSREEQSRSDQTRQDQSRQDQIRPDQTRPDPAPASPGPQQAAPAPEGQAAGLSDRSELEGERQTACLSESEGEGQAQPQGEGPGTRPTPGDLQAFFAQIERQLDCKLDRPFRREMARWLQKGLHPDEIRQAAAWTCRKNPRNRAGYLRALLRNQSAAQPAAPPAAPPGDAPLADWEKDWLAQVQQRRRQMQEGT